MSMGNDSVRDRIERASTDMTATQVGIGLAMAASVGFVLLFMQEPLVHDAMHNFRHAAGITCH